MTYCACVLLISDTHLICDVLRVCAVILWDTAHILLISDTHLICDVLRMCAVILWDTAHILLIYDNSECFLVCETLRRCFVNKWHSLTVFHRSENYGQRLKMFEIVQLVENSASVLAVWKTAERWPVPGLVHHPVIQTQLQHFTNRSVSVLGYKDGNASRAPNQNSTDYEELCRTQHSTRPPPHTPG